MKTLQLPVSVVIDRDTGNITQMETVELPQKQAAQLLIRTLQIDMYLKEHPVQPMEEGGEYYE